MRNHCSSAGKGVGISALVVLALLILNGQAFADTVSYTTTGFFEGGGSNIRIGNSDVSFIGADEWLDIDPGGYSNAPLGKFKTIGSFATEVFDEIGFTLLITQTDPTSGNTTLAGQLDGTLKRGNSTLEVVFSKTSATIAPVLYALRNLGGNGDTLSLNYGETSLDARVSLGDTRGDVNLVPLPAAAWGGMGLMGLIGVVRLRRRAAVAA